MRKSVEGLDGCTFRPQTNENKKNCSKNNNNDRSAIDSSYNSDDGSATTSTTNKVVMTGQRLHSESARSAERMIARKEKREEEMKEINTFRPRLCDGTNEVSATLCEMIEKLLNICVAT